jgi:hypothetical protein
LSLKKIQLAFTRIAVVVALPFSIYFLLYLLLAVSLLPNWLASLGLWAPRDPRTFSDTFPGVAFYLPVVVIATLTNRMPRYLFFSLAATFLSLVALAWLVFSEPDRNRMWRCKSLYVLSFSLLAVLLFPFLGIGIPGNVGLIKLYFGPYRPAIEVEPGLEWRIVEAPGLLAGSVKRSQGQSETRDRWYKMLGWADEQTFVYRPRSKQDQAQAKAGQVLAYHVDTRQVLPFTGSLNQVWRETCPVAECVNPLLAREDYPPHPYALVSPQGEWVAFVAAQSFAGPEDLIVMSAK